MCAGTMAGRKEDMSTMENYFNILVRFSSALRIFGLSAHLETLCVSRSLTFIFIFFIRNPQLVNFRKVRFSLLPCRVRVEFRDGKASEESNPSMVVAFKLRLTMNCTSLLGSTSSWKLGRGES